MLQWPPKWNTERLVPTLVRSLNKFQISLLQKIQLRFNKHRHCVMVCHQVVVDAIQNTCWSLECVSRYDLLLSASEYKTRTAALTVRYKVTTGFFVHWGHLIQSRPVPRGPSTRPGDNLKNTLWSHCWVFGRKRRDDMCLFVIACA